MKSLSFTLLALMTLSACSSSTRLPREDQWAFFEHWDPDHDVRLDINEFTNGYRESGFFRTWAGRSKSVTNTSLVARLEDANGGLKRSLVARADRTSVASAKPDGVPASDDKSSASLSAFVGEADINNDHKITSDEWARAMFDLADQNHDQSVSSIEFYRWQLLRG